MKTKHILKILIFLCLIFLVKSCGVGKADEITDEIIGNYKFQFPSEEIELLAINSDSTFEQKIYKDSNSYKGREKPIYVNTGKWSATYKTLNFDKWLAYCYLSDPDSILLEPHIVNNNSATWNKSTRNYNGFISISYDDGYIFTSIKNHAEMNDK